MLWWWFTSFLYSDTRLQNISSTGDLRKELMGKRNLSQNLEFLSTCSHGEHQPASVLPKFFPLCLELGLFVLLGKDGGLCLFQDYLRDKEDTNKVKEQQEGKQSTSLPLRIVLWLQAESTNPGIACFMFYNPGIMFFTEAVHSLSTYYLYGEEKKSGYGANRLRNISNPGLHPAHALWKGRREKNP